MPSFLNKVFNSKKNNKAQQQQQQQQQQQYPIYQPQQQQQQPNQYAFSQVPQQQSYIPPQHFSPTFPQQFSPTFAQQPPSWHTPPPQHQQQQGPPQQQQQQQAPQQYYPPPSQPMHSPPPVPQQHNPHVYIPHQAPPAPSDPPPAYSQPTRPKSSRNNSGEASRPKSSRNDSGEAPRPKSRGSIRASLRRIGSKASLRRKGTSSAGSSTVDVSTAGLMPQQRPASQQGSSQHLPLPLPLDTSRAASAEIQRQEAARPSTSATELTPPPSGGRDDDASPMTLPPQPTTQTPNSDAFDSDDEMYSDPYKNAPPATTTSPQRTALPSLNTDVPPQAPMPPQESFQQLNDQVMQQQQQAYLQQQQELYMQQQQQLQYQNAQPGNPLFFVRSVLDTIPASPATTLASPLTPTGGNNPFRKSSLATELQNASVKASSPLIGSETAAPDEEEVPVNVERVRTTEITVTVEPSPESPKESPKEAPKESPRTSMAAMGLGLQTNVPTAPQEMSPKSPATATKLMMQGVKVAFAPPPVAEPIPEPEPEPEPEPTLFKLADNNPFKSFCEDEDGSRGRRNSIGLDLSDSRRNSLTARGIKAIVPPASLTSVAAPPGQIMGVRAAAAAKAAAAGDNGGESSSRPRSNSRGMTPPPVPPRTPQNGKPLPKFKRAPEARKPAKLPDDFVPPPPPPMEMPRGWTAQWDEKEQKYAYYHGTRGREKQYDMPKEEYKKMSIKDKRAGKKKAVSNAVSNLGLYQETASPTTPTEPQISPLLPTPPTSAARTGGMAGLLPNPMRDAPPTVVKVGAAE